MTKWWLPFAGWLAMVIVMSLLWLWQRKTSKSGIVDVFWSLGVAGLATAFCMATTEGLPARRILISVLASLWGARLAWHVWARLRHEKDDKRYLDLREKWQDNYQPKLFRFYQIQAFAAMLFALPMWVAAGNTTAMGWLDGLAVLIWAIAIVGESIADIQLQRFKDNPENKGRVCKSGLWRYSRHPNYFFEWLHWWTYVGLAIAAPWGWLTILGPIAMLYFILFATGIPPAEASSLKSRGESYCQYQRETNAFFPGPYRQRKS